MTDVHFIHCRDCGEVFRPSAYDRVTEFCMTVDGYTEIVRDDCMAFLTRHARHGLETLRPSSGAPTHAGPVWDPLATTYWQVDDDRGPLLVQGWRDNIAEPLHYRLIPGRLVVEPRSVEVSEDAIREDVDHILYPGVASERRLAAFVARFKTLVWELDPATLEIVYDLPNDPATSMAKLPAAALARLKAVAAEIFDPGDAERIAARLTASAGDPDAFTVLVRQIVRVEPTV
jgi:hypothetical protein